MWGADESPSPLFFSLKKILENGPASDVYEPIGGFLYLY